VSESQTRTPPGSARKPSPSSWRPFGPRRARRTRWGSDWTWASVTALIVLAGALASVLGARDIARSDASKARLAFHLATADVAATVKLALQHEEDLIVSTSGFVTGNPDASPADFDRWAQSVQAMQRYPELQDFGWVKLVPASELAAFTARVAANPVLSLGPQSPGPRESLRILPSGRRPYYCLAVAGLARSLATFLPRGLDYCAVAPTLITARDSGLSGYAPVANGRTQVLGVETPVYRGDVVPATVAARRRAFVGWIGELIMPEVVLQRALEGHPNLAVIFSYDSPFSHVAFARGTVPAGGQRTKIDLRVGREAGLLGAHEGWSVRTFGAPLAGGIFENANSLLLLIGGSVLSLMVGLLGFVLGTGRRRALSLVREKTRELAYLARHDTLTGLPNRALVLDRAEQMLARVAREPAALAGALFIDIDDFKRVNDNLGHAAGDELLRIVGERLQGVVRERDTVGRLGGDEFVVLVESRGEGASVHLLADRVGEALRQPVVLDDGGRVFRGTASVGAAVGRYAVAEPLLRDADLALYAAKAAGKDRYVLFDAGAHVGVEAALARSAEAGPSAAPPGFPERLLDG
jgi:diguanylate cyclase (GGDEF)-like protein